MTFVKSNGAACAATDGIAAITKARPQGSFRELI
jgi:hypothetical protein